MKRLLLATFIMLCSVISKAEVIVITGVYQGKDLYIKNPQTSDGVSYCIFEVLVNGKVSSDEVNSPAFAIDLGAWGFKEGDALEIVIRCKENCQVKIINPEVIYPTSTCTISNVALSADGLLTWTSTGETAAIPFSIEQFKWNKWVKVGEVMGQGKLAATNYDFKLDLHSGMNQVRIVQVDHKGAHFSPEVKTQSSTTEVKIASTKVSKTLEFTAVTDYEIYSEFGALIKTGKEKVVDVSTFFKGKYYVNFDQTAGTMIEKK